METDLLALAVIIFFVDRKNENTHSGRCTQYGGSRIQNISILLNNI